MDAVSRLLSMTQLGANIDKRCLLSGATQMDAAGAGEQEAPFHLLLEGECQLVIGRRVIQMQPGDVVLLPGGASHRIITPGTGRRRGITEIAGDAFATIHSSRGGAAVIDLFCGHYTFDAGAGAVLFGSLPDPLCVSFGQCADSTEMLSMLSAMMRNEAKHERKGSAVILSALATVLLTMMLRSASGPGATATLWTAVADQRIAQAIESVVLAPGADWSIDRLSRAATMSRATFLRHFAAETGMTVGAFLTRLRVMAGADLLTTSDATVATVAGQVGYRSESAFSRAFRAETGTTPARFRRAQQGRRRP